MAVDILRYTGQSVHHSAVFMYEILSQSKLGLEATINTCSVTARNNQSDQNLEVKASQPSLSADHAVAEFDLMPNAQED